MLVYVELASEAMMCRHAESAFQTPQKLGSAYCMLSHAVQIMEEAARFDIYDDIACLSTVKCMQLQHCKVVTIHICVF